MIVFDGKNAILGRLASHTAKKLLSGEEITIVNADGVIITGNPNRIVEKYTKLRQIGSPQHGPFLPTQSAALVRRIVRSMLPYKTNKGRAALKKLRVYSDANGMKGESVAVKTIKSNYIRMGELSRILGGKK